VFERSHETGYGRPDGIFREIPQCRPGAQREGIPTVAAQTLRLDLGSSKPDDSRLLQFVVMGMEHIASGIDHLAFLLALLITARSSRLAWGRRGCGPTRRRWP
jgi:hypothetical protein